MIKNFCIYSRKQLTCTHVHVWHASLYLIILTLVSMVSGNKMDRAGIG